MLQIATFELPSEVNQANEFLGEYKPLGEIQFLPGQMIVAFDNGVASPAVEIANLRELLQSVQSAMQQTEIGIAVSKAERDDYGAVSEKRQQELTNQIISMEESLRLQEVKKNYLTNKIAELTDANTEE